MSRELPFVIYCVETYKNQKGLTGAEVMDLFGRCGVVGYIRAFYDSLHLIGPKALVEDLDDYIGSRPSA